jgi:hypothetical protein
MPPMFKKISGCFKYNKLLKILIALQPGLQPFHPAINSCFVMILPGR